MVYTVFAKIKKKNNSGAKKVKPCRYMTIVVVVFDFSEELII